MADNDFTLDDEDTGPTLMDKEALQSFLDSLAKNINDEKRASEKVNAWIVRYIDAHGTFLDIPAQKRHPSVLIMIPDVKLWVFKQMGSPYEFWYLMLDAAREWWPEGDEDDRFLHTFSVRFECEYNACAQGVPEFEAVMKQYAKWRGFNK